MRNDSAGLLPHRPELFSSFLFFFFETPLFLNATMRSQALRSAPGAQQAKAVGARRAAKQVRK